MEKRILLPRRALQAALIILLLGAAGMTKAGPVDVRTARQVGAKFINANTATRVASDQDLRLATTYRTSNGTAAFHVFNMSEGWVIVAADNCATPILAYSTSGQFDGNNLPPAMQNYLMGFVEQIGHGIDSHLPALDTVAHQWELVQATGLLRDDRSPATAVAPLLTTAWGTTYPYNSLCPTDPNGYVGHVETGSPALAMGQIMRYWCYPFKGSGSHSYIPQNYPSQPQSVDFGNTIYDWDNMPNSLNSSSLAAQINAVATLLWHCGVSMNIDYSLMGCGAYPNDIVAAMRDYFNYSADLHYGSQSDYTDSQWINKLKADLDNGRPVLYSGLDTDNYYVHAFVCDGYNSSNQLHFNWGWNGTYQDAYFALGALTPYPGFDFSASNHAIFEIHPNCTSGTTYQVSATAYPNNYGTVSGTGTYSCGNLCTLTATANPGYEFINWTKDGEVVSTNPTHNFAVTEGASFVANFAQEGIITFADANVKAICVTYWDTDDDGELSYAEAAVVTLLDEMFRGNGGITSFDELQYFTGMTSIESVFMDCSSLTSVVIPNSVTDIQFAFSGCSSLTSIEIPNSVNTIGDYAFENCYSLNSVIIGNSVTSIGVYAFYGCQDLTSITIPNSVEHIGDFAFYDCSNLASMTVLAVNPPTLATEALVGLNTQIPVYVPCESVGVYVNEAWGGFSNFIGLCAAGEITATADPTEGGTVTGAGSYTGGVICTLTATANEGYTFINWMENGRQVSTDPTYSFMVDGDASFVAKFAQGNVITFADAHVKALCVANWDTDGDGELSYAEAAAVTNITGVFSEDPESSPGDPDVTSFDELQYFTGLTALGAFAFAGCSNLSSIIIPNSVTNLELYVFAGCSSLTTIEIPNSVDFIGGYAFADCSGLISVIIGNSVTTIGEFAFGSCSSLTSIEIPNSVTNIENDAFEGCIGLEQIDVESGNTVYDSRENCNAIIETTTNKLLTGCINTIIPNSVTSIGNDAFSGCNLTSITIPSSVTYIGYYAFANCQGLTSMTVLADTPPVLGADAFFHVNTQIPVYVPCWSVEEYVNAAWGDFINFIGLCTITFADANVKAICVENWDTDGDGELSYAEAAAVTNLNRVFKDNTTITSFDELQYFTGLTSLQVHEFSRCSSLSSIVIPDSVTTIGAWAFNHCTSLTSIVIPNAVTALDGGIVFSGSGLEQIIVESGNTVYDSRENCNAIIETSTNKLVVGCKNTVIPNSVTSIGTTAFSHCSGLTTIEIPNSVGSIGSSAFSSSGLTAIEIPNSVTSIGSWAFSNCSNLISAEIPNSIGDIASYLFQNCSSLSSIKIPNSVSYIEDHAFSHCSGMTTATIGNSVFDIGEGAFSFCSGLTSLTVLADDPPMLYDDTSAFYFVNYSIPVYIPCGSEMAYASASWGGFSNFIGACREITVTANPIEGGTVTGGGTYNQGASCTLTATPATGYTFVKWTKNGTQVSTSATYSFTVTESANYVAHFEQIDYYIYTTADPEEGGQLTGEGTYHYGDQVTLTATANPGYQFVKWSEWGLGGYIDLSTSPTYTFTLNYLPNDGEEKVYIAYFEAVAPPTLQVVAEYYPDATNPYSSSVKVSWDTEVGGNFFDFESGVIPSNWNNDNTYPWIVTTPTFAGYNGSYCMKSGNGGVASSTSSIEATVNFVEDGSISFLGGCYGEDSSWDVCKFFIDNVQQFSYGNLQTWSTYSFDVTAGTHTFKWSYTKDSTVNPTGDAFFVDDVTFTGIGGTQTDNTTYSVYRANCDDSDITMIADNVTGNQYIDQTWANLTEGDYKYGVEILDATSVETFWSNCLTKSNETFIITAVADPAEGGTVAGQGLYYYGHTCTLTATANPGYEFVYWTQNGVMVGEYFEPTYSFTVTESANYVAHFEQIDYYIYTTADPEEGGEMTGEGSYHYGDQVTLTATPNEGYQFINWTFENVVVSTNTTYTFTVNNQTAYGGDETEYVAHFSHAPRQITVSANPVNGGTVTGGGTYAYGQTCTLSATANPGYEFVYWTKDGVMVGEYYEPEYTFTVLENTNFVAHFEQIDYYIYTTADPEEGGEMTGEGTYHYGDQVTLTATPNEGYQFINWTFENVVVSTNATYTFTVNDQTAYGGDETEYVAHFSQGPRQITVSANPVEGGTVTGGGTYDYGTQVTLIATEAPGYIFYNWTKDGVVVGEYYNPEYTFTVTEDANFVAHFQQIDYYPYFTINPEEGGYAEIVGDATVHYGDQVTIVATPNEGYDFVNWTVWGEEGLVVLSTSPSYTFTMDENNFMTSLYENSEIEFIANFEQQTFEITVTADPVEGGTVEGGGIYPYGAAPHLLAVPNEGYTFTHWTLDGEHFDDDDLIQPTVTGPAHYVAHFEQISYEIMAYAIPEEGGVVTGSGNYVYGQTVTLTATANEGYTFVHWTRNQEQISANATYSFIASEATADAYYAVFTNSGSYEVTALANPSEGGVVTGSGIYDYGTSVVLTATANEGYTFLYWAKNSELVSEETTYVFTLTEDSECVAYFAPEETDVQITRMSSGWTWYNTYIDQDGIDGLEMVKNYLGEDGIQIKAQQGYTSYFEGFGWMGTLTDLNNESSYKVQTLAPRMVNMIGEETTPEQHPITLKPGWNWIGYPLSTAMSVSEAFSGITPTNGDQLKAQEDYANYYEGMGWMGTLTTIEPGMGLLYKSNNTQNITLVYPTGTKGETLAENITSENNHWVPNMHGYPDNMTVTAIVKLDDEELTSDKYELAAFANGECRGSVRLMYIEPLNRHIAFLTITGEEVETLTFSLCDTQTGEEIHGANEQINFSNNATAGDVRMPYTIHFRGTVGMDEWANSLQVFPNPVRRGENVTLGQMADEVGEAQVEIINALGQIETVRTTSMQTTIAAPSVAGVYTLRITVEGKGTCYRKLVVR